MERRTTRKKSRSQPAFTGQELIAYRQAWSINSLNGKWPSKPTWSENRTYTVVNGYRYLVRQFDDGGSYYIGGQINKVECALLLVHDDEFGRVGVLQGLRKSKECISPPGENPTGNLLVAAWRLCYKLGLHHINISDIAKIHCNDKEMFVLSDMELLTKGISWYEKYLPITAEHKLADDTSRSHRSWGENKRIALSNKWGPIYKLLKSETKDLIAPYINGFSEDTPAHIVFQHIKELSGSCSILANCQYDFMFSSGLELSDQYIWNTIPITTRDPPPSPYL
jgi:hypothetical protein